MLRKEVNDLLTQTDKGTPMGELFRQYWIPALLAWELPENDCPPVRVKLLGEEMVAFRDSDGNYGLIEEFCAHRRVSLWFGRNEQSGIRCLITAGSTTTRANVLMSHLSLRRVVMQKTIKLTAYPMIKIGDILGLIWDQENTPPEPQWEFCRVAPEQTFFIKKITVFQLVAGNGGWD